MDPYECSTDDEEEVLVMFDFPNQWKIDKIIDENELEDILFIIPRNYYTMRWSAYIMQKIIEKVKKTMI